MTLAVTLHAADNTDQLPRDMSALVERMKVCGKIWSVEPKPTRIPKPGEGQKLEHFRTEIAKHHCGTLDRDLAQMRVKYTQNADIVRLCDRFLLDPRREATRMAEAKPPETTLPVAPARLPLGGSNVQPQFRPSAPNGYMPAQNPTMGQPTLKPQPTLPAPGSSPAGAQPSVGTDSTHP